MQPQVQEPRIINQTVKRHIVRFPEEFCFRLTEREVENLKTQFFFIRKNELITNCDEFKKY